MKRHRLLEPAIVAALLLAHVPGLAEELLPPTAPDAPLPLLLPAPDTPCREHSAERLSP